MVTTTACMTILRRCRVRELVSLLGININDVDGNNYDVNLNHPDS